MAILNIISDSKFSLLLISLIVTFTLIDSQFLKVFYGTDLGTPGNFHLLLFMSLVIFASVINIMFIRFTKSNDTEARSSRPLLFRTAYISTISAQTVVLLIMYLVISEMLIFHAYDRVFLLLAIVISHFLSAFILGTLSVIFLQWLRLRRSLSILTYALVFIVIMFLVLTTLVLLIQTHTTQSTLEVESVSPKQYITLVLQDAFPSTVDANIAFIYGLGTYALPILAIASWILTVSLHKDNQNRQEEILANSEHPISVPNFCGNSNNPNLVTDPNLILIFYSPQIQFLVAINGQISGLLFAVTLWILAKKRDRKV